MTALVLSVFFVILVAAANAGVVNNPPSLPLNDGNLIPIVGLGTWFGLSPSGQRVEAEADRLRKAVGAAIDYGYRHIDTAHIYFDEHIIGEALKENFDAGKIKREDIFITTKLWNDAHRPEKVEPAIRESLKKLKLDYVDLYLIHWPVAYYENGTIDLVDFVETWKAMEELKKKGLARSIGVSNFNEKQLTKLLAAATIKPAVLQIEVNPNLTQKKLVKFAQDNGIVVTAYSPFGSLPSSKRNKDSPAPKWDDPILSGIGKKYGKTVAQVVLRYLIQRGLVVIPKSLTPSRIEENINVFNFQLTPEEIQKVEDFNLDQRVVRPEGWEDHPEYPFEKKN